MSVAEVGSEYLEHLTETDLRVLASASDVGADALRRHPRMIPDLIARPEVFQTVYGAGREGEGAPTASPSSPLPSPFLVFAVTVHRAAAELASLHHLPERSVARQRVPLFDAPQLAEFLDAPWRRLFLAELLASFTRVTSGRYPVRTARGWRWRRFSELDPVRLAAYVAEAPARERPGAYRRLGDVALFLTGVFPDHMQNRGLGLVDAARLVRAARQTIRISAEEGEELARAPAIVLFEHLGAGWYRTAVDLAVLRTARLDVVAEVAERFRQARRILNYLADRYLFPPGRSLLPQP